jgi:hypothetical protein
VQYKTRKWTSNLSFKGRLQTQFHLLESTNKLQVPS